MSAHTIQPPTVSSIAHEPRIRVRVLPQAEKVVLGGHGWLTIGPTPGQAHLSKSYRFAPPVTVRRSAGAFFLTDGQGQSLRWTLPAIHVAAADQGGVTLNDQPYPAAFVILPAAAPDKGGSNATSWIPANRLCAVNYVPIEQYLPGVIEHELYGSWDLQAFVAQAIAARSYAIAQMAAYADRPYDVTDTAASQMYGGKATNPKAIKAVRQTRGQVLIYHGRVVPAYFSSCAGGAGQDAVIAFPDERLAVDIPPLRGRTFGWGKTSPDYQWGPVYRNLTTLSRRIAAWGKDNDNAVAGLGVIRRIQVATRSRTGRPATFRLVDRRGHTFTLPCEWFRFACDHTGGAAANLPKLRKNQRMKSSFVTIQIRGDDVTFHGRGFGHGVGMCQWSAQEMASHGYSGQAIVRFFYPGAKIKKLY